MAVSRMDVGRLVFVRMEPRNEFLDLVVRLLYWTGKVEGWKGGWSGYRCAVRHSIACELGQHDMEDWSMMLSDLPSVCYRRSMEQCSVQSYEALLASPLPDALFDCFVFFGREVRGVGNVGETHCEVGKSMKCSCNCERLLFDLYRQRLSLSQRRILSFVEVEMSQPTRSSPHIPRSAIELEPSERIPNTEPAGANHKSLRLPLIDNETFTIHSHLVR